MDVASTLRPLHIFLFYRKVTVGKKPKLSSGNTSPCPFRIVKELVVLKTERNALKCRLILQ
jgi:hypothetical protein